MRSERRYGHHARTSDFSFGTSTWKIARDCPCISQFRCIGGTGSYHPPKQEWGNPGVLNGSEPATQWWLFKSCFVWVPLSIAFSLRDLQGKQHGTKRLSVGWVFQYVPISNKSQALLTLGTSINFSARDEKPFWILCVMHAGPPDPLFEGAGDWEVGKTGHRASAADFFDVECAPRPWWHEIRSFHPNFGVVVLTPRRQFESVCGWALSHIVTMFCSLENCRFHSEIHRCVWWNPGKCQRSFAQDRGRPFGLWPGMAQLSWCCIVKPWRLRPGFFMALISRDDTWMLQCQLGW